METEWKIAKSSQTCGLCAARFGEGQPYFSALFEAGQGFERRDYCAACFKERRPESVYSFWKTAVAENGEPARRQPVLDPDSLLDFLRRLGEDQAPQRAALRYVLALMLARKKVLRFAGSVKDAAGPDRLVFVERRGGARHEIAALDLPETALAAVSAELGQILGLAAPERCTPSDAAAPVAAPETGG